MLGLNCRTAAKEKAVAQHRFFLSQEGGVPPEKLRNVTVQPRSAHMLRGP